LFSGRTCWNAHADRNVCVHWCGSVRSVVYRHHEYCFSWIHWRSPELYACTSMLICIIVLMIMSGRTYLWYMSKLEGFRRLQELRDRQLCLVAWRICIVFFINYKCDDDTSVSFTMCTIVRECFKCRTLYDVSKAYRGFAFYVIFQNTGILKWFQTWILCAFFRVNEAERISWEMFSGKNLVFRTVRNYKKKNGNVATFVNTAACSCVPVNIACIS
jgi:hypothetical protein